MPARYVAPVMGMGVLAVTADRASRGYGRKKRRKKRTRRRRRRRR